MNYDIPIRNAYRMVITIFPRVGFQSVSIGRKPVSAFSKDDKENSRRTAIGIAITTPLKKNSIPDANTRSPFVAVP